MAFEKPLERAHRWDVLIQQGSTFERTMDFVGLDLTLLQFRGQIRRSHSDSEVLAAYSFVVSLPETLTVFLDAEQTEMLPAEKLVHDIEAYIPQTGFVARVLEGRVTVTPEVTR